MIRWGYSFLSTAFKDHDINDTGHLDSDYLLKALLSLNLPVEPSDMTDLFECVGREKERVVVLEDFLDIVTELKVNEKTWHNSDTLKPASNVGWRRYVGRGLHWIGRYSVI